MAELQRAISLRRSSGVVVIVGVIEVEV